MNATATLTHTLDESTHTHVVDGRAWPSVTTILSFVPPVSTFLATVRQDVLDDKRILGQAVHAACHYFDDGDLDHSTIDRRVVPYLDAWQRFRQEKPCVFEHLETLVHHPLLGYAGRLDRLGAFDGRADVLDLIDLKSGYAGAVAYQLAAYAEAWRAMTGETRLIRRWSVELRPDASYRLLNHSKRRDFEFFKAAFLIFCEVRK